MTCDRNDAGSSLAARIFSSPCRFCLDNNQSYTIIGQSIAAKATFWCSYHLTTLLITETKARRENTNSSLHFSLRISPMASVKELTVLNLSNWELSFDNSTPSAVKCKKRIHQQKAHQCEPLLITSSDATRKCSLTYSFHISKQK
jgi:hypothetical protein